MRTILHALSSGIGLYQGRLCPRRQGALMAGAAEFGGVAAQIPGPWHEKTPTFGLHPPHQEGNTGGKMKACWATGNGALQEWEACPEVYFSLPPNNKLLCTHMQATFFPFFFFFFFLPISSGQHYLPFNHSNSSNQSLPCAVVHQGCNFCNCLRYQLICCDFLIEVVRWKDFHHFNRTCWTTFWFGPVTSQNLHWFPRQLFWTMTLCDVPSSPVKNNKLLFLFSIFLSRLNKEACCVS